MAALLQITGLSKSFNTILFSDVNLNVQGTIKIGLIGDNGSGKSSLLKILAGLDFASEGKIY